MPRPATLRFHPETIAIDKFTFLEQRRANGTPLLSAFDPGMADRRANDTLPDFKQFVEQRSSRDLGDFFDAWLMEPVRPADRYLFPGGLRD